MSYRPANSSAAKNVDIIIIGAGASGIEIARIASREGLTVALFEQGKSNGRHLFQQIPLMVGKLINDPDFVDARISRPQPSAGNREIPVLSGRGLGGSSRINGNVAYAGPNARYQRVFGKFGLDFSHILDTINTSATRTVHRGHSWNDALSQRFLHAAETAGHQSVLDPDQPNCFNGASVLHVNTRNGRRFNHFNAYQTNADHTKITIYRQKITKLLFRKSAAIGVVLNQGQDQTALYADEIILCAGAIGSPEVLQNNGIGPTDILESAGIPVFLNNNHVGRHLKDHANLRIPFSCPGFSTLNQKTRGLSAIWEGIKYVTAPNNSILSGPGASVGLNRAVGSDIIKDAFRIQLVHFTQDRSNVSQKGIQFERAQKASLGLYTLWPESEGSVSVSPNGLSISHGFLSAKADVLSSLEALKYARNLIQSMGFEADQQIDNDEQLLRHGVYSGYHLLGSNRMANSADHGVVDTNFRVFDTSGLSVCDASVMPDHLSSHSYLPSIAIARKFAQTRGWTKI